MHVVLTYSDNILGSATGTPRGKNGDKREKLRKKPKHVLEVLLRFSVGYILEMDSDRGRSVWQSGQY